jgi:Lon protease-like protein
MKPALQNACLPMSASPDPSKPSTAAASAAPATTVRLFPLPSLVMFPHVIQPLHVFEPRYCDMLEDALSSDRVIAMVMLQPGWEKDYDGRPPIAPVACQAKIVAHERLPTGRHNILIRGLKRVVIRHELPLTLSFRVAEVDPLEDYYPASGARRTDVQRRILQLAGKLLPDSEALQQQLDELLAGEASLGMLTDVFAFTLGFSTTIKQQLLTECNVDLRAAILEEKLLDLANRLQSTGEGLLTDFPPRFSLN